MAVVACHAFFTLDQKPTEGNPRGRARREQVNNMCSPSHS